MEEVEKRLEEEEEEEEERGKVLFRECTGSLNGVWAVDASSGEERKEDLRWMVDLEHVLKIDPREAMAKEGGRGGNVCVCVYG